MQIVFAGSRARMARGSAPGDAEAVSVTVLAVPSAASSTPAWRGAEKRGVQRMSAERMQTKMDHGLAPGSFFSHGKLHQFSPRSLGVCASTGRTGKLRNPIVWYVALLLALRLLPWLRAPSPSCAKVSAAMARCGAAARGAGGRAALVMCAVC